MAASSGGEAMVVTGGDKEAGAGGKEAATGGRRPEPPVSSDWYHESGEETKAGDLQSIQRSIQESKRMLGECETDFTKVERKKSKWD